MAHPVAKLLTGFFVVAVLLVVAALIFTLSRPAPALAPLPQPNGYDDFLRASALLSVETWDYANMSEQTLRATVARNEEALKVAKTGLSRECRVPLDYSTTNHVSGSRLAAIKRLAQAIMVAGRLAELENRPADAAESYLDVIRLGGAISHGGLLIDLLVGVAVESIGMAGLEKLAPTLDAKQCREAAVALEACNSRREAVASLLARERTWGRRTYGLKWEVGRLLMFKSVKQTDQRATAKLTAQQTRTRVLLVQLATSAYELEKGERPKGLADLVPAYLKTIPQDPLTGTNMTYR